MHIQHAARKTSSRVWPKADKEPLVDVDGVVIATPHHQSIVPTTVRPLPQQHNLFLPAAVTGLRRIAFLNYKEFFPIKQTLIFKHPHKAVESPIIVHHAVASLPFAERNTAYQRAGAGLAHLLDGEKGRKRIVGIIPDLMIERPSEWLAVLEAASRQ